MSIKFYRSVGTGTSLVVAISSSSDEAVVLAECASKDSADTIVRALNAVHTDE